MKKLLIFLIFLFFVFTQSKIYALTPTENPDPTPKSTIDDFKNRVASKVAELKLVEKRGIIGIVVDSTSNQITINDTKDNTRFVDVDELTKFSSDEASFGISDINKNMTISVIGLYNKQSRRILARSISVITEIKFLQGGISSIDKEEFTFNIATEDKDYIIDVETITKTSSYTKDGSFIKSGFSKLQEGQNVIVIGVPDKNDKKRILASRIIILEDIPMNPKIVLPAVSSEDVVPSTGSGKKLTPILR